MWIIRCSPSSPTSLPDVPYAAPATQRLQRGAGEVRAEFAAPDAGRPPSATRLRDLYQTAPGRALLPRPEPDDPAMLVLLTTSGGLAGGDRMQVGVTLDPGASVMVLAQAAEKIYRAAEADADTELLQSLRVGAGAWAEWLPQETILFDGARFRRSLNIDLAAGARLLLGDLLVYGRTARGERWQQGRLHDRWDLRRDGRLVWTERQSLQDDIPAILDAPAGFDGAVAQGMILYAAPDALTDALAERLRGALAEPDVRVGLTRLDGFVLLRLLSRNPQSARHSFGQAWSILRHQAGWPAGLPRLWLR